MPGAIPKPLDYAETGYDHPEIPDEHVETATELIEHADETEYTGQKPAGVFAAAVYAATIINDGDVTQTTLSNAFSVSTGPIRGTYRLFIKAFPNHQIPDSAVENLASEDLRELLADSQPLTQYTRENLFTFVAQKHNWVEAQADGSIIPFRSKYAGKTVTLGDEPTVSKEPLLRLTSSLNLLDAFTTLVEEYNFDGSDIQIDVSLSDEAYRDLVLQTTPGIVGETGLDDFKQSSKPDLVELLATERDWELPNEDDDATAYFSPGSPPEITMDGITTILDTDNPVEALSVLGEDNIEITEFKITGTGYAKLASPHIADYQFILDDIEPGTIYANMNQTLIVESADTDTIPAIGTVTYSELTSNGRRNEETVPAFTFAETIIDNHTQIPDDVVENPEKTVTSFINSTLTVSKKTDENGYASPDEPDRLEESLDGLLPVELHVAHQLTDYENTAVLG